MKADKANGWTGFYAYQSEYHHKNLGRGAREESEKEKKETLSRPSD